MSDAAIKDTTDTICFVVSFVCLALMVYHNKDD